jgi:hypothetical protein
MSAWEAARRARAHLALVEREHREALERLVAEVVACCHHVAEEDVGALAAEFERDGDQVLRRVLHDQPARGGLAGERDLGDAIAGGQRLARLESEAVDDVQHAGGQQVTDQTHQVQDRRRRLLGGFEDDRVSCRQRRRELPRRHQDREVPRDDLPDHAKRFVEVIGDGVLVDLGQRALLGPYRAREVPEVVDGQWEVSVQRLADRFAVVPRLGERQGLEIGLDAVGDLVEDVGAFTGSRLAPRGGSAVSGVQRLVDVRLVGSRNLAERLTGDRSRVLEIFTRRRRHPLAADEVAVPRLVRHQSVCGTGT